MESINTESNDEAEFWEKIDENPILLQKKIAQSNTKIKNYKKKRLKLHLDYPPSLYLEKASSDWHTEKNLSDLQRVKYSHMEEVRAVEILVRNKTRKELLNTIVNIQRQFQQDMYLMRKDQERMQEDYSYKIRVVNNLIEYIILQADIGQEEIDDIEFVDLENSRKENILELKQMIQKYNQIFEITKTLNASHKEEASNAATKIKTIDVELNKIKNNQKIAIKTLESTIGARENAVLEEFQKISDEFENYKLKIAQEIQIRALLEQRQHQFIRSLQDELKNAKIILQNPTLRLKTYEKLKDSYFPLTQNPVPKTQISLVTTKEPESRGIISPVEISTTRSIKSNRRAKSSFGTYKNLN